MPGVPLIGWKSLNDLGWLTANRIEPLNDYAEASREPPHLCKLTLVGGSKE
jgi:hypothetical protein